MALGGGKRRERNWSDWYKAQEKAWGGGKREQRLGQKGTESGGTEGMGVNLGKKKTEMGENRRGNMGRGGEDDADQRRSAERGGNRQQ